MNNLIRILFATCTLITGTLTAATSSTYPQQQTDSSGNRLAVWMDTDTITADSSIVYNFQPNAGSWGTQGTISTPGEDSLWPLLAMNSAGDAVAIWIELNSTPTNHLYGAIRPFGGPWTTAVMISQAGDDVRNDYKLTINGSGVITATYSTYNSMDIFSAGGTVSGGWVAPVQISN